MGTTESIARAAVEALISGGHRFGRIGSGTPFNKVAIDLDWAWAYCRVSAADRRLLMHVRHGTWGQSAIRRMDECSPCRINVSELARKWRLPRSYLSGELSGLVRDEMLIKTEEGYRIGKDVFAWMRHGRIDAEDVAMAASGDGQTPPTEASVTGDTPRQLQQTPPVSCSRRPPSVAGDGPSATGDAPRQLQPTPPVSCNGHPHIRNAPASEDLRREEEKTDRQEGGRSGEKKIVIRSQDDWGLDDEDAEDAIVAPLEPIAATLVTDDGGDTPEPLPARVVSEDERLDDELRSWARAMTLKATRSDDQAEAVDRHVSYWRSMRIARHEVAAYVAEACGPKLPEITGGNVARFVNGIFKKRQPDWTLPPVPPEWAPAPVAGPKVFRASPEEREAYHRREAMQIERRQGEIAARRSEAEASAAEGKARIAAFMAARGPAIVGGGR